MLGYYFFDKSQKEPEPSYAIDENYLFAEVIGEQPSLKLLWNGEPVQNFYSTRIKIWNDGNDYLDSRRLYAGDPIRIEIPTEVKVLNQKIENKSRENLDISTSIKDLDGQQVILIDVADGEALEPSDGLTIKIYFTSDNPPSFKVKGRVKGVQNGFSHKNWTTENKAISAFNWMIILSLPIIILSIVLRNIFRYYKYSRMYGSAFKEKYKQHKLYYKMSSQELKLKFIDNAKFYFVCIYILYTFMILFPDYTPLAINPNAINQLIKP